MGQGGEQKEGKDVVIEVRQDHWTGDEKKASHLFRHDERCVSTSITQHRWCHPQRVRRMFAGAILLAALAYYCWSMFLQHTSAETWAARAESMVGEDGTYGIQKHHRVDKNLVRLKSLDENLLPGGTADSKGERRLVFVGDAHGCKKELLKLLHKINFNEELDHLVLAGDTISKGPDNVGVLDELIRLNATSVRGNHEDNILREARRMAAREDEDELSLFGEDDVKAARKKDKDRQILKSLKPRHLKYLNDMPLMFHIPTLPQATGGTSKKHSPITEHILVVHAGLVPGVRLKKQDPYYVMNMRSINRRTLVPSALHAGKNEKPWYDIWNWYNDKVFHPKSASEAASPSTDLEPSSTDPEANPSNWLGDLWKNFFGKHKHSKSKPQVVIYGHDSRSGLQLHRWSKGLDSSCVSGGKLTALVLDARGEQEVVSVKCKNYRD